MIAQYIAIGIFSCVTVVGCASFPGKEIPTYTYDQIVAREQKPSVDYDAKFLTFEKENAAAVRIFQEEIDKVFSRSDVFLKFGAGVGGEKYHLSLVLRNEGNMALGFISGFICGLSLFVIPAYARDDYILTVDVKKGEEVLKQYQYKDHLNTWIQLFLVFMTPTHHPDKVVREVMDNMLLKFLYDLESDKILEAFLISEKRGFQIAGLIK
jgi:hypothetical protein